MNIGMARYPDGIDGEEKPKHKIAKLSKVLKNLFNLNVQGNDKLVTPMN